MSERSGPASAGPPSGGSAPGEERLVIRDRRRIDPTGTKPRPSRSTANGGPSAADLKPTPTEPGGSDQSVGSDESAKPGKLDENAGTPVDAPEAVVVEGEPGESNGTPVDAVVVEGMLVEDGVTESETVIDAGPDQAEGGPDDAETPVDGELVEGEPVPAPAERPLGAELEALRAELDERTRDLQRVSAEYANYRKRVDRDRGLVVEQATAGVLAALLPVLDDLDRARDHGDLVGPFGGVAEQLTAALAKFGLTPFGEKGDPFDPTRHEAVAHLTSADVTEPTCIDVLRRGYLLGDRLLRAALVAVADPEQ